MSNVASGERLTSGFHADESTMVSADRECSGSSNSGGSVHDFTMTHKITTQQ
ncbi:hypothetical protein BSLA_01r4123 [Burkholderia stabilis]|nr:hypothetical protein BSLA_01r4123 [Burkholderia stabilis]